MKQILFTVLMLILSLQVDAQTVDNITSAVKLGNATQLSEFYNSSVEIIIDGKDKVYTKAQAQMVMNDFFKKNPPVDFNIAHNSERENSQFLIGNYTTVDNKSFRIILLLRAKEKETLIHQIRIQ